MGKESDYQIIKENAQKLYHGVNSVFSPVFKEKISFTADGFSHILFKNKKSLREESSQKLRFRLIPLARKLIEISTTYQEFEESIKEVCIKKHKHKTTENKLVQYWGIIAIINNQKIKVIIRKIGTNGSLHFWSVIPAWVTHRQRDTKFFTTMKGNPEED